MLSALCDNLWRPGQSYIFPQTITKICLDVGVLKEEADVVWDCSRMLWTLTWWREIDRKVASGGKKKKKKDSKGKGKGKAPRLRQDSDSERSGSDSDDDDDDDDDDDQLGADLGLGLGPESPIKPGEGSSRGHQRSRRHSPSRISQFLESVKELITSTVSDMISNVCANIDVFQSTRERLEQQLSTMRQPQLDQEHQIA